MNGIDFWAEGPGKGTIASTELLPVPAKGRVVILSNNDWLGPDGKRVCRDKRSVAFSGGGDARTIDFDVELIASDGPVKFGDTKEGTFGIRVPTVMDVDSKKGGHIVNSDGLTDDAAWGKPARLGRLPRTVDGQEVGIAILNHPSSFRYPNLLARAALWIVRGQPLWPERLYRIEGGQTARTRCPAGESIKLRYRVIFHAGDEKAARIAEAYDAYSKESRAAVGQK